MIHIKFSLPDYDDAYLLLLEQVLTRFHSLDPLLQYFPPIKVSHAGPVRYVHARGATDQEMDYGKYGASGELDIANGRVDQHTEVLYQLAEAYVRKVSSQCFKDVSALAGSLGNTMGRPGTPSTVDTLLQGVETVEIRFNHRGDLPIYVVAHPWIEPDQSLMMATPVSILVFLHPDKVEKFSPSVWTEAQRQRYLEIIHRKEKAFYAAKRTRRLS